METAQQYSMDFISKMCTSVHLNWKTAFYVNASLKLYCLAIIFIGFLNAFARVLDFIFMSLCKYNIWTAHIAREIQWNSLNGFPIAAESEHFMTIGVVFKWRHVTFLN
jgi:hypothetical protein